jgi:hypothetical protein
MKEDVFFGMPVTKRDRKVFEIFDFEVVKLNNCVD